jgi:hypothetical protein
MDREHPPGLDEVADGRAAIFRTGRAFAQAIQTLPLNVAMANALPTARFGRRRPLQAVVLWKCGSSPIALKDCRDASFTVAKQQRDVKGDAL